MDFRWWEAENGIEALELVGRRSRIFFPRIAWMPFISGVELARQVREIRPATQIAFLSGFDDFSYAQQAIQYNIISYMLKPISMADLTENLIQIKQKIDRLFSEFAERRKWDQYFGISSSTSVRQLSDGQHAGEGAVAESSGTGLRHDKAGEREYPVSSDGSYFRDENGNNQQSTAMFSAVDTILKKNISNMGELFLEDKIVSVL